MSNRDPYHRRPFEQADGYREDGDLEDKFNKAKAITGDTHDNTWNLLFAIREAARANDWARVKSMVDGAKGDIPYQQFSKETVQLAAAAGQDEIVKAIFGKNFRLPAPEGAEMVETLALKHADKALPSLQFMLAMNYAPAGKAVEKLASIGDPAAMEIFRVRGEDIFMGGGAFAAALYAGNGPMMAYLHVKGAEIFRPATAAGLRGGIAAFQQKNPQLVKKKGGESAITDLMRAEAASWNYYYAYLSSDAKTLEGMREIPPGVAKQEMTLIQMAARAGSFEDVIKFALKEKDKPLRAADLTRKDKNGVSALTILVARGEEKMLVSAKLWLQTPEDLAPLHAALKELGAGDAMDLAALTAETQRERLRELAQAGRFTLKPRKP
ncbi:MAG: hypothetical protein ACAH80_04855 [Alphaproteobacteria bacterium]